MKLIILRRNSPSTTLFPFFQSGDLCGIYIEKQIHTPSRHNPPTIPYIRSDRFQKVDTNMEKKLMILRRSSPSTILFPLFQGGDLCVIYMEKQTHNPLPY